MASYTDEASPQKYARIGGLLYLFIIVAAGFGELFVRNRLIVWGDAAATANNILGSESTSSATVTDGCVVWFDANAGTHCAVASNGSVATSITSVGPTGAQTTIQGWVKINVNGTVRYIPFW